MPTFLTNIIKSLRTYLCSKGFHNLEDVTEEVVSEEEFSETQILVCVKKCKRCGKEYKTIEEVSEEYV